MALSISEAQAVMTLLRWMGAPDFHNDRPTDERALRALELLRGKAFKALSAGVTEQELRDTFERFTAERQSAPPAVPQPTAEDLAVSWGEDEDARDVVILADHRDVPFMPVIELKPMDAIDIGAQLVSNGHQALDAAQWGE